MTLWPIRVKILKHWRITILQSQGSPKLLCVAPYNNFYHCMLPLQTWQENAFFWKCIFNSSITFINKLYLICFRKTVLIKSLLKHEIMESHHSHPLRLLTLPSLTPTLMHRCSVIQRWGFANMTKQCNNLESKLFISTKRCFHHQFKSVLKYLINDR